MGSSVKTVTVPRDVLIRALTKARILYTAVAEENGHGAGPDDECWAEFERLAEYVGTTAELIAEETERLMSMIEPEAERRGLGAEADREASDSIDERR